MEQDFVGDGDDLSKEDDANADVGDDDKLVKNEKRNMNVLFRR